MIKVKLNNLELWALRELAYKRQEKKEKLSVKTKKIDRVPDTVIHYVGMKGEYSVARWLDLPFNIKNMAGGDGGFDLVHDDRSIDVKTTSTSDLIFMDSVYFKAQYAFLVRQDVLSPLDPYSHRFPRFKFRDMIIVGWVSRLDFLKEAEFKDYGYGRRVIMPGRKLKDPGLFLNGSD